MEKAFIANLCRCNMCDLILVDQNPQIGAEVRQVYYDADRQWVTEEGKEVAEMQYEKDNSGEFYWACPVCLCDDYLTD
jgi:hypothetical protein